MLLLYVEIYVCFRHYDDVFTLFNVTYREFKLLPIVFTPLSDVLQSFTCMKDDDAN